MALIDVLGKSVELVPKNLSCSQVMLNVGLVDEQCGRLAVRVEGNLQGLVDFGLFDKAQLELVTLRLKFLTDTFLEASRIRVVPIQIVTKLELENLLVEVDHYHGVFGRQHLLSERLNGFDFERRHPLGLVR